MKQKASMTIRMMLWLIVWIQNTRIAQCKECDHNWTRTLITLRETLKAREVTAIAREMAINNYSDIRALPNLRMITACRPAKKVMVKARGLRSAEWVEDDGNVRTASWALDRLDQRELPLDNRAYDPSNCTRHHGRTVETFVIDTGCDVGHSLFYGRTIGSTAIPGSGYSEGVDDNGHGTGIASLLIGQGTGVARDMKVTCVKVLDKDGSGAFSDVAEAVEWIIGKKNAEERKTVSSERGIFMVMSLTGMGSDGKTMDIAVKRAAKQGIVTFAAAGNQGRNACDFSPGREAIGVGAMGRGDRIAGFSNWGVCVDAVGPGEGVVVADIDGLSGGPSDRVRVVSGTSFSAPLVAGLVGLLWEGGGVAEAKRIIQQGIVVDRYRMPTLECYQEGTLGGTWAILGLVAAVLSVLLATVLYL